MSLLAIEDLKVRYGATCAVDGVSFSVQPGEAVGLVGESGSGKTQTALAALGLLPPTAQVAGSIRFDGTELIGADAATLDAIRAVRLSMVFQDPTAALNPYLRVGHQLGQVLAAHALESGRAAQARIVEMLSAVGLPDPERQARCYPHQLSGGMRQRVMIASALIGRPDLLIADEPTTALDVTVQAQILELLAALREDTALLLITHDLGVVAGHCERILVLEDGRIVESGATGDVFRSPSAAHTRALLDAVPRRGAKELPPAGDATVLAAEQVRLCFEAQGNRLQAVNGVDVAVKSRETVAIVGESGSGKSSLARLLTGLVAADTGRLSFNDEDLPLELDARPRAVRRALQMVFQDPVGSLDPQMRVVAIVAEPLDAEDPSLDAAARRRRVAAMLSAVGLDERYLDRYPHQLSGGQAQRVAIARALITRPAVLICDEAVAALDGTVRRQILRLLADIQNETGLAIVFISHDLGIVRAISHRVVVMYLGRIVEAADSEQLFTRPRHPYTRALLDAIPVPDPDAPRQTGLLPGEVPSILAPPPGCPFHPRCRYAIESCASEIPALRETGSGAVACIRADEIDLATGPAAAPASAPR